jgi:hypothetical protein
MPSYKTAFGSYLKAEDLAGRPVRISIDHVSLESIKGTDGKDERKLVAHFTGKDKTLVLNRTNADSLSEIFGTDDYDEWVGSIVLYPDTTMYGGKRVPCIRVRAATAPAKPAPPPEPEPFDMGDDAAPF